MSEPTRPTGPELPQVLSSTHQLRRQGRVFGFMYDLDFRITTLSDADEGFTRPPLLPVARRFAAPVAAEPRDVTPTPAAESVEENPERG
jgi:hypothetical protein